MYNIGWKNLWVIIIGMIISFTVMAVDNTTESTVTSTSTSTVKHDDQPPPGARAPGITVTNSDVCVSGVSGGVQTGVLGLSVGTTIQDKNCERIKLARELRKGGMKVASVAILCQDPRVFQAMIMSGTPCPAKGMIGADAAAYWNAYPELRPDFKEYLKNMHILIDAGYINPDGTLVVEEVIIVEVVEEVDVEEVINVVDEITEEPSVGVVPNTVTHNWNDGNPS